MLLCMERGEDSYRRCLRWRYAGGSRRVALLGHGRLVAVRTEAIRPGGTRGMADAAASLDDPMARRQSSPSSSISYCLHRRRLTGVFAAARITTDEMSRMPVGTRALAKG